MVQRFFASPTDIRTLFGEIEQNINLCYVWGGVCPCFDVLKKFNSCEEIDGFGYAIDTAYRLNIYFDDSKVEFVNNRAGYYNSNESIELHINNIATNKYSSRVARMSELYCPPGAQSKNRELFSFIKKAMRKKWTKINDVLYGLEVFQEREHLAFVGDQEFSFKGQTQYLTSLDAWYDSLPSEYKSIPFFPLPPEPIIHFYASAHDILELFNQFEQRTSLKYWLEDEDIHIDNIDKLFSKQFQCDTPQKSFHAIDLNTYGSVDVRLGGIRTDVKDVVALGTITYMKGCPKYGGTLLRKLNELVEVVFSKATIKHYGIYYIGPEVYAKRNRFIFDNGDPRFKCVDDEFVHVWRSEWDAHVLASNPPQ